MINPGVVAAICVVGIRGDPFGAMQPRIWLKLILIKWDGRVLI